MVNVGRYPDCILSMTSVGPAVETPASGQGRGYDVARIRHTPAACVEPRLVGCVDDAHADVPSQRRVVATAMQTVQQAKASAGHSSKATASCMGRLRLGLQATQGRLENNTTWTTLVSDGGFSTVTGTIRFKTQGPGGAGAFVLDGSFSGPLNGKFFQHFLLYSDLVLFNYYRLCTCSTTAGLRSPRRQACRESSSRRSRLSTASAEATRVAPSVEE